MYLLAFLSSLPAQANEPTDQRPSRAMLEFLAEFSEVDQETYDLLEFHAQRDLEKAIEETRQENNDE
jgi:hypothetical protein